MTTVFLSGNQGTASSAGTHVSVYEPDVARVLSNIAALEEDIRRATR